MSAGDKHPRPNLLVPSPEALAVLHRMLTSSEGEQLMARFRRVDTAHDIPYLAGYDVDATTRFLDRDFVHALSDPAYAKQIIGAPIDTGLSPQQTSECILRHEGVEKTILDSNAPFDLYDHHDSPGGWGAHEWATVAEHELVKHLGGDPARYEAGLKKIIDYCEHKTITKAPRDLACAPYLDDPDQNEKRIIKRFREMGLADAFKVSKETVDYSPATKSKSCGQCSMWQGSRNVSLSHCSLVDGLVRADRRCSKFEPMEGNHGKENEPQAEGAATARP